MMKPQQNKVMGYKNHNKYLYLFIIIFALVIAKFILPYRYLTLTLNFACIHAIATSGLDILFGYTGQVSFGHAGFYAIGAYTSTILSLNYGIPVWLTILIGALLAALIGAGIAIPASNLVKHFLSVLTIAFGTIVYVFISVTTDLTNGFSGIRGVPPVNLFGFEFDTPFKFFFLIATILCIVMILKNNIINSRVGRAFIALRENTHAANGMGINVRFYKVLAFSLSAFLTGLAGALYAHLVGFISPDTFNATTSNMFMTELLFGGRASLFGPVVGSFFLVFITEALQVLVEYQGLFYGLFIILVLFFMPNGVVGLIKSLISKLKFKKLDVEKEA